jgi:hypothetical protein
MQEEEEEEGPPMGAPQVEHRVDEADAPYLDFEEDQEIQAYNLIKSHVFIHMPTYDPNLLQKISMDTEFATIWRTIGWENINPMDEMGSHHLTIQFLCTLVEDQDGISFYLFQKEYNVSWKDLSLHRGFHRRCSIETDHALYDFNRNKFWGGILGEIVIGTFKPHNTQIQHPTLRFMHRLIAMTFFPSHDIRWIRVPDLKMLFVVVKKIKVAPIREMFHHWLDIIKNSTTITYTSLVTRIATGVGALDEGDVNYIEIPRIIINEHYLIQGHNLKTSAAGAFVYFL